MGRRVGRIAATALLVAGCGGGTAPAAAPAAPVGNVRPSDADLTCERVLPSLFTRVIGSGTSKAASDVTSIAVDRCVAKQWSPDVLRCLDACTVLDELPPCGRFLTAAQRADPTLTEFTFGFDHSAEVTP